MRKQAFRNLIFFLPFAIGLGACAAGGQSNLATHFWQADAAKTERDYRRDQSHCLQAHQLEPNAPITKDSLSFEGYRNCMIERGYVLRTY